MNAAQPATLLEQLDERQNAVLSELDELNRRIEALIGNWHNQQEPQQPTKAKT